MLKILPTIMLVFSLGLAYLPNAKAVDVLTNATNAVTGILFDHDANEFTTYRVRQDGFVDITFARNTPDPIYSEILNALQNHPDIPGVLAGKGGPACSLF